MFALNVLAASLACIACFALGSVGLDSSLVVNRKPAASGYRLLILTIAAGTLYCAAHTAGVFG